MITITVNTYQCSAQPCHNIYIESIRKKKTYREDSNQYVNTVPDQVINDLSFNSLDAQTM